MLKSNLLLVFLNLITIINRMEHEFSTKFHLLNSQRSSQDIIWSSSESSDSENVSKHMELERNIVKTVSRKRKRSRTSSIKRNNLSCLDITFSESVTEKISPKSIKEGSESTSKGCVSPILNFTQRVSHNTNASLSPILSSRILKKSENVEKTSPILHLKSITPKCSVNVRKKLFNSNTQSDLSKEINPIIDSSKTEIRLTETIVNETINNCNKSVQLTKKSRGNNQKIFENITNFLSPNNNADKKIKLYDTSKTNDECSTKKNLYKNDTLRTNLDIIQNKVDPYFNNNFNTQALSQHSISEYESTPQNSSKTSEEIDNISLTQERLRSTGVVDNSSKHVEITDKSKKIKYKKDGLAYRLNLILKKQNTNISLWQHERFLAMNSNFILPAEEYTPFRIQNMQFKYGVYLLECKDVNSELYFILINSSLVSERQINKDTILKLYKPFKIITLENSLNLIVNASKFECTGIM